MKPLAYSLLFFVLIDAFSVGVAVGEPSKSFQAAHRSAPKPETAVGVDTIKPNETDEIAKENSGAWSSLYVGVNAGTSFEATVGKNVLIPLGSGEQ
jgi:hypothetical protein